MSHFHESTKIGQDYSVAYAAHYQTRNLQRAFQLYSSIIVSHPDTPEADHCRMQIQNIINSVVPKQELLDAQVTLLLVHFENGRSSVKACGNPPMESELSL